jgi:hypothetical protein
MTDPEGSEVLRVRGPGVVTRDDLGNGPLPQAIGGTVSPRGVQRID